MTPNAILLIDDEPVLRETISDSLRHEGFEVTLASSGEEGLEKFRNQSHDLVIVDLIMEGMGGIEVSKEILKLKPQTPMMILTGHGSLATAIEALQLKLHDYILKPIDRADLIEKVNDCLKNEGSKHHLESKPSFEVELKWTQAGLTRREREVALLTGQGYNDAKIGELLGISPFTVKFHLKRVFKKLGLHKRVELVVSFGKNSPEISTPEESP